jgi:hypothetical protein
MKLTASISSLLFLLAIAVPEVAAGNDQAPPSVAQTPAVPQPSSGVGCPKGCVFFVIDALS